MKVIKPEFKEKQKKELFEMLEELPKPPAQAALTESQLVWWYWVGNLLVQTGKFAELDMIHLQNAAVQLDLRNRIIKEINRQNESSSNGVGGLIQVHTTGARQIDPLASQLASINKSLDNISAHFGLSIKDRNKIKEVDHADPNQTDLFKEFMNIKSM